MKPLPFPLGRQIAALLSTYKDFTYKKEIKFICRDFLLESISDYDTVMYSYNQL